MELVEVINILNTYLKFEHKTFNLSVLIVMMPSDLDT